jgi:hypothetical protein
MNHKNFENPQKNAISSCTKSSKFMSCKTNHSPSASEVGSAERSEPRGVEGTRFLANRFFSKKYGKLVASSPIKKHMNGMQDSWGFYQHGVLPIGVWKFINKTGVQAPRKKHHWLVHHPTIVVQNFEPNPRWNLFVLFFNLHFSGGVPSTYPIAAW